MNENHDILNFGRFNFHAYSRIISLLFLDQTSICEHRRASVETNKRKSEKYAFYFGKKMEIVKY